MMVSQVFMISQILDYLKLLFLNVLKNSQRSNAIGVGHDSNAKGGLFLPLAHPFKAVLESKLTEVMGFPLEELT